MSANYYSQTPNFVSASSEDVDPRTRLFSFQHSLGQLIGNNGMGPEFDFTIGYSPTSADDYYDLGIGVAPALTIFDANNGQLSLSSGETYKVDASGETPIVQQNKMRTFDFTRMTDENGNYGFRVTEHDGSVTDLSMYDDGIYVTTRIYTALGYSLTIDWEFFNSWGWGINTISDDSGVTLLSFTHDTQPVLTFYPNSSEEYSITLTKANDYLSTLSHSGLPEGAWHYNYEDVGMGNGLQTLTETVAITGLRKKVIYNNGSTDGLMLFPYQSGEGSLPAVTYLTIDPGFNQPLMETAYTPDSSQGFPNYLGYDAPQGGQWDASTDYVYSLAGQDYFYSTTLTQTDSNGQAITTTYTYNNYHLLSKLEVQQGKTIYTVDTWYYADAYQSDHPDASYDDLPAQYQYPLSQTLTWTDDSGTRTELTQYIYDEFGNLTQQTDPDGTKTDYEFYSAEGEADSTDGYTGCPADPNGFANLMKSKKVKPAPSDYDDVPVRATYYHYSSFDALDKRPMVTAIVKDKESLVKLIDNGTNTPDKQPLTTLDTQYYSDEKTSFKYGLVSLKNTTTYYTDDKGTKSYLMSQNHDYNLTTAHNDPNGDTVIESIMTLTTFDGLTQKGTLARSRYSGKITSLTDLLGTPHEYYYDGAGRFDKMITNEDNTDYERLISIAYTMAQDSSGNATALSTTFINNNDNTESRLNYDSMGRVISIEKSATEQINEDFSTVLTREYDSLGRIYYEKISDSYIDKDAHLQETVINIKTRFDDWGYPCGHDFYSDSDDPDNSIYLSRILRFSPVDRKYHKALQSVKGVSAQKVIQLNDLAVPGVINTLDANDNEYSRMYHYYDGLKRLRQVVDPMGNSIVYGYDDFDRIKTATYADGTAISTTYAPQFSIAIPITKAAIDKDSVVYQVGSREFDGLGRIVSSTVGGRTEKYSYPTDGKYQFTITDNVNRVFTYTYDPLLENALTNLSATFEDQTVEQSYTYFKQRGLIDTVKETGQQTNSYTWYGSGQAETETFINDLGSKTPSYYWSVMNNPVRYTDISGNELWISYYLSGSQVAKPETISDPEVITKLNYDDFGRLWTQTAEAVNSSGKLETIITYDDYGREHVRTLTPDSGDVITITTRYYENNQVAGVKIEKGGEVLADNSYYYDLRNRLYRHDCSGTALPKDGYGQEFNFQTFEYDCLNNITTCTTTDSNGTQDVATFNYKNEQDPTQLTSIEHHGNPVYPSVINLEYYDDGRLKYDEAGRLLAYDAVGRLFSIETNEGTQSNYRYDGFNTLVFQSINDEARYLYFRGSLLVNQINQTQQQQDRYISGLSGYSAVSQETL
ncbi:RHS repeat domain-containing protein [Pseudescherichia sp.]|uniref:RHS repeat domain-containing protein n=1 Tax=Pseudescherichia sp. TaxID=2055881 RepID=UPI002897AB64|nr:RHS repeat domain-containing protein [Pseudescherichia sp.]